MRQGETTLKYTEHGTQDKIKQEAQRRRPKTHGQDTTPGMNREANGEMIERDREGTRERGRET